jgi:chemotaxis protein CheD
MTIPPRDTEPGRLALVYLCPGQLFASAEPTEVTTIVSSCVAVCLLDPATGVGGVCHFQLPQWQGTGPRTPSYADVAIEELLARMAALGARPETIQAKLFGGACLTPHVPRRQKPLGEENLERTLEYLRASGIAVSEEATGGWRGRTIVYHTHDGHARVKVL